MITITHLSKKFDSRGMAGLHHLSFRLEKGQIMGLIGPNGSGKTTLLKTLNGTITPDDGEFEIQGPICFFPSNADPINMNVQKFLVSKVTLAINEEKKIQLARDLADTFEFTFQLRQDLFDLSSGQRQKVLLASELINQPSLLLMDEPFTHLDSFTRKDILKGLFQYIRQQGMTVLWVTHELEEGFRFSDIVGVMNFGKLEQLSPPVELLKSPRNLFVAQFIGYQNFFPVKFQNESWLTPWGPWSHPFSSHEALMVVPDESWKMSPGGPYKIEECFATKQGVEYRIRGENHLITVKQGPQMNLLHKDTLVNVSPRWEECFLIPL